MASVYPSLAALKPMHHLLSEAGAAIDDRAHTLLNGGLSEVVGAGVGVGAGAAAGAGMLTASAASGTAGATAITSGLAALGHVVGGGMVAGIGVVAAPAVAMGAGGLWLVTRYNRKKLLQAKETLLQEALRKRDALSHELHATNASNRERIEYLSGLLAQLEAAVRNLQADLKLP